MGHVEIIFTATYFIVKIIEFNMQSIFSKTKFTTARRQIPKVFVWVQKTKTCISNNCYMFYPAQVCFIATLPGNGWRFIEKITFSLMLFVEVF